MGRSIDVLRDTLARDVLDNLLEGCLVLGPDLRFLYVNDTAARHGRKTAEELLGRSMLECFPGIEETPGFEALQRCMATGAPDRLESASRFSDGSSAWFELRLRRVPEGVCILSLDVSEKKRQEAELARVEAQFRQAQKMEAVGRLAGGVAHDFNNILTVVLSYSSMLLEDRARDDPARADIGEILKAGQRASELTRQLLAFSRQQVLEPAVLDPNEVVAGIDKMLMRLLGADVELTVVAGSPLGKVLADPGQIEQVLMNLVVNARDAMPLGGKLTIETKNTALDEAYARTHYGVEPGEYVMIGVTDTGIGMDAETLGRIFDPFFTTKDRDKGTGLGLSTVYGIVTQSHGHVRVYSEPGRGTTFEVHLPRVDGAVSAQLMTAPELSTSRGTETILLVDDDDQVRTVASTILRKCGYLVFDAANAGEALLLCEKHTTGIHLLLTDIVLPRLSGPELAARLAATRPAMKVLYMSGYADEAILHDRMASGAAFLQKPLTRDKLTRKVRQVLSGRGSGVFPAV